MLNVIETTWSLEQTKADKTKSYPIFTKLRIIQSQLPTAL